MRGVKHRIECGLIKRGEASGVECDKRIPKKNKKEMSFTEVW